MARRKKRDFWDDIEEDVVPEVEESGHTNSSVRNQRNDTDYDEGFRLTKCMPVKVIARILLCVAAVVVGLSGYICYKYVEDRYTDGTYSTSYFDSNGFSREYNDSINKLIRLIQAVESEGEVSEERAAEMTASIMGTNSNFSFFIMNENQERVLVSSDDAKDRIETSNHFLQISTLDNAFEVNSGVPTMGLNKTAWKSALDSCTNAYNIYTAVDNNLTQQDSFYESYLEYQKMTDYFGKAKIAGIAALVVFIILLIFCVVATGTVKGYDEVRLTWFDKIFTEVSAVIIAAVVGALLYGMYYLMHHEVKFDIWLKAGDAFLIYVVLIRAYFSLVRRIKSGTFILDSLIYKVCHAINKGLNHLPKAVKIIIILLFLVALNGGLVYALLYLRDYTFKNIPIVFIVAPIIFIIELISFISCIFGVGEDDRYYEEYEEEPEADEAAIPAEDNSSWEDVDFGKAIKEADVGIYEDHSQKGATQENIHTKVTDKTVVLSQEERQKVLDSLGFGETQMLDTQAVKDAQNNTRRVRSVKVDTTSSDTISLAGMPQSTGEIELPPIEDIPALKDTTVILDTVEISQKAAETAVPSVDSGVVSGSIKAETPAKANALEGESMRKASEVPAGNDEKADAASGKTVQETAESLGYVDFIQLNKDVRKMYRMKLKARSLGVTLRAPEKPILLDIDKSNAIKVLSILFDNIEKYAQEGSRVIIEMYAQNGKMIYLMKNTIGEDRLEQTTNAMGRGLMEAKRIVQSEKGKFINSVEGETYKVGILLDVADVEA